MEIKRSVYRSNKEKKKKIWRGHPDLNRGPLDLLWPLQSNALPLSYTPSVAEEPAIVTYE